MGSHEASVDTFECGTSVQKKKIQKEAQFDRPLRPEDTHKSEVYQRNQGLDTALTVLS